MVCIDVSQVVGAGDFLAKHMCVPGRDGARPQETAGVRDCTCDIFRRSMQAFAHNFEPLVGRVFCSFEGKTPRAGAIMCAR